MMLPGAGRTGAEGAVQEGWRERGLAGKTTVWRGRAGVVVVRVVRQPGQGLSEGERGARH
jgi:hypothetical protein